MNNLIETCGIKGCGKIAEKEVFLRDDAEDDWMTYEIAVCQDHYNQIEKSSG